MSEKNNKQENQTTGFVVELYEWLEAIAFALSIVVILFTFLFRVVSVSGPSMNPTAFSTHRRTEILWSSPSPIPTTTSR